MHYQSILDNNILARLSLNTVNSLKNYNTKIYMQQGIEAPKV